MSDLRRILNLFENTYKGEPLEKGGTSIAGAHGSPAPAIRDLFNQGHIKGTVVDYGAGKYARNADYLRAQGLEVYAYDPFNGQPDADGYSGVSTVLPDTMFDVGFTSYVLNVVPEHTEAAIIREVDKLSKVAYHITRNKDIFASVKKALERKDNIVSDFFLKEFANEEQAEMFHNGMLDDDTILEFCHFGVQTTRGFQRIPQLEQKGFSVLRKQTGYMVFKK